IHKAPDKNVGGFVRLRLRESERRLCGARTILQMHLAACTAEALEGLGGLRLEFLSHRLPSALPQRREGSFVSRLRDVHGMGGGPGGGELTTIRPVVLSWKSR
ncbi:hypothetical protein, partial [Accumulibacter sp.]|uniref:hypothetical protein n=1 Tax=Accumulibacter sp. TaxID=2053492 RepID=UPI002B57876D